MRRHEKNPIITRKDIPEVKPQLVDVSSVFNPGAVKFKNQYVLLLRVQNRGRETYTLRANSPDGVHFQVNKEIIRFNGIEKIQEPIYHCYDMRITPLEGRYYIMFAMDMDGKCSLGLGVTDDFVNYEFLGIVGNGDIRNGVLFPEKINGKYARLDRPNKVQLEGGPSTGNAICLSFSEDLLSWEESGKVIEGRWHFWDELIGSGPPPVKTKHGWLHIYHGMAMHYTPIYQAGVLLLDLENPQKVIGRCRYNLLEPRELYETTGQVPNVVFPSGMITENMDEQGFAADDSQINIYYGAADTSVGLAITSVKKLVDECLNNPV